MFALQHLLKGACYWELVVIVAKTVTPFEYNSKTEAQIPMMIKVHADLQLNSFIFNFSSTKCAAWGDCGNG